MFLSPSTTLLQILHIRQPRNNSARNSHIKILGYLLAGLLHCQQQKKDLTSCQRAFLPDIHKRLIYAKNSDFELN